MTTAPAEPTPADHRAPAATEGPSRPRARRTGGRGRPTRGLVRATTEVRDTVERWRDLASPVTRPVGAVLGWVTGTGRLVLVTGVAALLVSGPLGWGELRYAGWSLVALFALSCLLTVGRMSLAVDLELDPPRVLAGDASSLEVRVTNTGGGRLLPVALDVPTAGSTTRFPLPAMAPGAVETDVVVLPGRARGVYPVGPAASRRGDPFGLLSREVVWTRVQELFVHPRTVPLDGLGTGLLKDLEGRSTNEVSMSDLAFHALREYAPGDDRRHIHWLSSAKRSAASGSDDFMVRQFLDTRRSHVGVLLDTLASTWLDEEDFETAVAVGASVAVRTLQDGMDLSEAVGPHVVSRPARHTALDVFSRATPDEVPLETAAGLLAHAAPDLSSVLVVTGALAEFGRLRRARRVFGPDVNVVAVRVEAGAAPGRQRTGGITVLTVGSLADLPLLLRGGGAA
ncbi:DUF58 domain-containing protein [Phycicoccus sp. MAQZ13P-2]|uniref:DUF58 domain-containing protein n=1 Tax=Phycicoccus mangrovi TaxID=2840470 RepID=UPI001C00269B|nr:DUF58 domain-containing protein [Phycicoccus mangrovi]MBT9258038.1 DUF58 domain-containing protein [Phycicoccus mangrovi]MBT9276022.1 DUF58 domain-containing protein [Phycicoccus mangrovi]